MADCRTCELVAARDAREVPLWDRIVRTEFWDVVHTFDTTVEGWLVLVARRHIPAVADLTDDEAAELGPLIRDMSRALHAATGCVKTYVAQFAEHPRYPHVHVHLIPRAVDQPEDRKGSSIFSQVGVAAGQEVPPERMTEIATAVRDHLAAHAPRWLARSGR